MSGWVSGWRLGGRLNRLGLDDDVMADHDEEDGCGRHSVYDGECVVV